MSLALTSPIDRNARQPLSATHAPRLPGLHLLRRPTISLELLIVGSWVATSAMLVGETFAGSRSGHSPLWWCTFNGMAGMRMQGASQPLLRTIATGMPMWALMSLAMMLPATLPAVRQVAAAGHGSRRQWSIAQFLTGYIAIWLLYGGLALTAMALLGHQPRTIAIFAALCLAAAWQLTPWKRLALHASRRHAALASHGRQATTDTLRFGAHDGAACVGSCWAIMLVMALATSERLLWMVALTALIFYERRPQSSRR